MTDRGGKVTLTARRKKTVREFGRAWGAADLERLMELITDDCVYSASVGPEPGRTYVGRSAVKKGFRAMLAYDSHGQSKEGRTHVIGNVAVAEWSYVFSNSGARHVEIRGCDIIKFNGTRICRKDAYRKLLR